MSGASDPVFVNNRKRIEGSTHTSSTIFPKLRSPLLLDTSLGTEYYEASMRGHESPIYFDVAYFDPHLIRRP